MPTSIAAPQAASDAMAHGSLASLIQNAAQSAESPISADALSTKEVASYIRSLSNFSLSDLQAQPQQLQSKSEALHQQLSELCISQTDAFIHIHQAEQEFSPFLDSLSTHLDDLISQTLPDLQKAADAFTAASKPVLAERERLQNVTEQYERGHLSDLLEIPTLVHTCVKAGQHSDAIQLAEHLVGLLKRLDADNAPNEKEGASSSTSSLHHGQRSTYLSLLIETVSHLSIMKDDLLSSFSSSDLKLPAARKSVTVLRKLNSFESHLTQVADRHSALTSAPSTPLAVRLGMSENQLCLAFLKARIRSFHSALDAMGSPSSFSSEAYLRRYIDLWREEMADTLGMAFPLFIDESSSPSSQAQSSEASHPDMVTPAYLVSSFATSGLVRLRDTVSAQLQVAARRSDSSSSTSSSLETLAETFANIHTQLSYASASLTRFGFDFGRLLFIPAASADPGNTTAALSSLEATWLDAMSRSLDHTFASMHGQLDQHRQSKEISLPSRRFTSSKLPRSALEDLYSVSADNADPSAYDDYSRPNIELVDYPLFAKLLNQLMEWINALQVFAPTSLSTVLSQKLDRHLASITQRLLSQTPGIIAKLDDNVPQADQLLADEEAQSLLQHLEEDVEAKQELQRQLIQDRESAILGKVLGMWHSSVVSWTLHVVQSRVFDLSGGTGAREADDAWRQAQEWIGSTRTAILHSSKQRRLDANQRQKAHDDAVEAARVKAEQKARQEAEEMARKKNEEEARQQAEAEAKRKAEEETKRKAEEEAKRKAEEEARKKAEEEARKKAEAVARKKAEDEAKRKAEEEAKRKAEEEARKRAEAEAETKRKAKEEEQARLKAEEEKRKEAEAARLKAEEQEKLKAEAEAKAALAKKQAEEQAAKAKAEQEAREAAAKKKAEEEAAAAKAEAEAQQAAKKQAEEEAARAKAEQEAEEATSKKRSEEEAAAKAKADELAQAEAAEKEAAKVVADGPTPVDASKTAEQETGAVPSEAIAPQAVAQSQAATQVTAEPQREPAMLVPASSSEPRSSSPAPKKFSLADKLRQRKEERDRAAAAAAAAKAVEPKEASDRKDEGEAKAPATGAAEAGQTEPRSKTGDEAGAQNQDEQQEPRASQSEGMKAETSEETKKESSVSQPDADETVQAEVATEEAADEGDDEEDDKAADGEDSGANTPATPTTPNPADGSGGGGGSKKNKKKNKKKKK